MDFAHADAEHALISAYPEASVVFKALSVPVIAVRAVLKQPDWLASECQALLPRSQKFILLECRQPLEHGLHDEVASPVHDPAVAPRPSSRLVAGCRTSSSGGADPASTFTPTPMTEASSSSPFQRDFNEYPRKLPALQKHIVRPLDLRLKPKELARIGDGHGAQASQPA